MSEMIDRVTRAVFYSLNATGQIGHGSDGSTLRLASISDVSPEKWDEQKNRCKEVARAVFSAMRDPPAPMALPRVWSEIIDEILSEQ